MIIAMLLTLCAQNPASNTSEPAKDKPAEVALKVGDILRVNTGIPDVWVPSIDLMQIPKEGPVVYHEIEYWAFAATLKEKEPLAHLQSMRERGALFRVPNGARIRIIAIHKDWWGGPGLMKDVPVAEVEYFPDMEWAYGKVETVAPIKEGQRGQWAIPLPYLVKPSQRPEAFGRFPVLKRRIDVVSFADAEREWKERKKRSEKLMQKGAEEAKRVAGKRKK